MAISLKPHYPKAFHDAGVLFIQNKYYEKGVEYLSKAVQLKQDYKDAYNNLGVCYYNLG